MKKEKTKMSTGRVVAMYSIMAVLLLIVGFGATYAWLTWQGSGSTTTIAPATFSCGLTDTGISGAAMSIPNTENPLTDAEGLAKAPYKFSVTNNSTAPINYYVLMVKDSATLDNTKLTLSLRKTADNTTAGNQVATKALSAYSSGASYITNGILLHSGTLATGAKEDYFMRWWLNSTTVNADSGKNWNGHLYIYCSQK